MNSLRTQPAPTLAEKNPGPWLVWDRDQTRVIASGQTFEEAKRRAAVAGERSVILTKRPPAWAASRLGRDFIYKVAVFVAPLPLLPIM